MKFKGNYDKLLTIFLVIIFVIFLAVIGPVVFEFLKSEYTMRKALYSVDDKTSENNENTNNQENTDTDVVAKTLEDILNEMNEEELLEDEEFGSSSSGRSGSSGTIAPPNYDPVGKIEIPKTGVNYPIYGAVSKSTLESGVAVAYGPGVNQTGNTVIYGHNLRNGKFFSNNKRLAGGDLIYVTDLNGNRFRYRIYNIYVTTSTDASYMVRDTEGRTEISLQTCTDDNVNRLIIWAVAE